MYRNNPSQCLRICVNPLDEDFPLRIKEVARTIVEGWGTVESHKIQISELKGGNTNLLYVIERKDTGDKVVVRVFGAGSEKFIDRENENAAFSQLSRLNLAPTFHGLFSNGRVEGFVDGRDLRPEELWTPKVLTAVSRCLAVLHNQLVELKHSVPIWDKIEHLISLVRDARFESDEDRLRYEAILATDVLNQARVFQNVFFEEKAKLLQLSALDLSLYDRGQLLALEEVFCHNDVLAFNIMVSDGFFEESSEEPVRLIDFEYAGYNARAYDIANFFNEFAGFAFDIEKDFPDASTRHSFITSYLQACCSLRSSGSSPEVAPGNIVDEDFRKGFERMVLQHTMASHLMWGCWAIVQASVVSDSEFSFLEYGEKRLRAFFLFRDWFS